MTIYSQEEEENLMMMSVMRKIINNTNVDFASDSEREKFIAILENDANSLAAAQKLIEETGDIPILQLEFCLGVGGKLDLRTAYRGNYSDDDKVFISYVLANTLLGNISEEKSKSIKEVALERLLNNVEPKDAH